MLFYVFRRHRYAGMTNLKKQDLDMEGVCSFYVSQEFQRTIAKGIVYFATLFIVLVPKVSGSINQEFRTLQFGHKPLEDHL